MHGFGHCIWLTLPQPCVAAVISLPMEIPHCFYRISVKALILDESRTKFLVVQEDNGKWELPGGGMDWGQNEEATIIRELREEMSVPVKNVGTVPLYFFTDKNDDGRWYANVLYETEVEHLNFVPSNECVAVKFVTGYEAKYLNAFSNVHILGEQFDPVRHVRK